MNIFLSKSYHMSYVTTALDLILGALLRLTAAVGDEHFLLVALLFTIVIAADIAWMKVFPQSEKMPMSSGEFFTFTTIEGMILFSMASLFFVPDPAWVQPLVIAVVTGCLMWMAVSAWVKYGKGSSSRAD